MGRAGRGNMNIECNVVVYWFKNQLRLNNVNNKIQMDNSAKYFCLNDKNIFLRSMILSQYHRNGHLQLSRHKNCCTVCSKMKNGDHT